MDDQPVTEQEHAAAAPAAAASKLGDDGADRAARWLAELRGQGDFPALSARVLRVQQLAVSEEGSLRQLAAEVQKDVGLTQRLMRMVNSAGCRRFRDDGEGVASVQRAVSLVGQAGVRNLALAAALLDHLQDRGRARRLQQMFSQALLAASAAQALAHDAREGEEAFLGGLFRGLGPLIVECHLPEQAALIRTRAEALARVESPPSTLHEQRLQQARQLAVAVQAELGLSWDDIALAVARDWGLPESLQRCLRVRDGAPLAALGLLRGPARVPALAQAGHEAALLLAGCSRQDVGHLAEVIHARHGPGLGTDRQRWCEATARAVEDVGHWCEALGLARPAGLASTASTAAALPAPQVDHAAQGLAAREALVQVLAELGDAMALPQGLAAPEVLRALADALASAFPQARVVLALREPRTGLLRGRLGRGEGGPALASEFALSPAGDPWSEACERGEILRAHTRTVERRPNWHREALPGPAEWLSLPLAPRGVTVALLYVDQPEVQGAALPMHPELPSLLKLLRSQALMALRQAAG